MKNKTFLLIAILVLVFLLSLSFGFGNIDMTNSQKLTNSNSNSSPNFSTNSQNNSQNFSSNSNFQNNSQSSQNGTISLIFDKLEIAKTREEEQKGLMFRENLCENCGMIFEFENEDYRRFWMKNTLIDLDIIFINESGRIVNIEKAKAEKIAKDDPDYPGYLSTERVKYVLEVNSGFAAKMNLESGKILQIDKLLAQTTAFDNNYTPK